MIPWDIKAIKRSVKKKVVVWARQLSFEENLAPLLTVAIKYLKYLLPTDVFNVLVWKAMLDIDKHIIVG